MADEKINQNALVESGEDHVDEGTDLGAVRIHNNVLAVIAREAAAKVPGVVDLTGSFVDGIAGMMGKKSNDRGIRVQLEGNHVIIDLNVVVAFGAKIPQVAWRLQNDVREAIQQMTGKNVKAVNVIVQGVQMPADALKSEPSKGGSV